VGAEYDLGTFSDFESKVKKKEPIQSNASVGSVPSPSATNNPQSSFLGGALGSQKPNQVVQPNVGVPNPNRNVQSSN
ncbi:hypothetical protein, partial [Streptococcus pneumoniae]|uniref:hypothetical protein n=1 Tax=Streptococcus pneumoniae TaxID=1313 RepID=UPI001E328085